MSFLEVRSKYGSLIPVSARRHRSGRRRGHPHHNDRHDRHRQRSSGGRGSIGGQQLDWRMLTQTTRPR